MQRKDWFFVVFILLLMIGIDQASKLWASGITEMSFGIFRFILIHNHGAMLGLFSDLPAVLRIVTLSTSGIFILCIYSLIQYLISKKLMGLRIGLSILVGGILGNVLDRILHGYVIDFMAIQLGTWHSPVWNLADAVEALDVPQVALADLTHGVLPDSTSRLARSAARACVSVADTVPAQ